MKTPYISKFPAFVERCKRLGVECYSKRVKRIPDAGDKALMAIIDIDMTHETVYCISYKGKEYDCGDLPRDMGKVIKGIEIAINAC